MSFTIFWKGKLPFQAIKTRTSKSRNIDIFQKVLTHGSGPKMAIFLFCFFSQYRPGKSFYDILDRKIAFLGYKKKNHKSRTIDIIPKGLTHGFGQKMAIFPTFFFQAIYSRKMSFMIFQNEKTPFQAIKTRSPNKIHTREMLKKKIIPPENSPLPQHFSNGPFLWVRFKYYFSMKIIIFVNQFF